MRLEKVRITNYRSIDDSGWVDCKDNVLCLVGKNESGKTSFLVALEKLAPVDTSRQDFNIEKDYPRKGLNAYKKIHDKEPANVITAIFRLDEEDIAELEEDLGAGVLKPQEITIKKGYDNQAKVTVAFDEGAAVHNAVMRSEPADEILAKLTSKPTLSELEKMAAADASLTPVLAHVKTKFPKSVGGHVRAAVYGQSPDFLYFDDYSVMRGRVSLPQVHAVWQALQGNKDPKVSRPDRTFLALLDLAGTTPAELMESRANVERLTANLEAAAIGITEEVFEFWTQNQTLRVQFQVLEADEEDNNAGRKGPIFHTRIWNDRHRMTVSFDERSKGFVWFFSFLAYFSKVKDHPRPVILLLDEPGLSLHATAQGDFLRFIEERLATDHQVFYTTHSPFMVDSDEPQRIRLVEDRDTKGTVVSDDFLRSRHGEDTLYPLLAAMGIDISRTLFIGPNTLLVEGPSEVLYFPTMSKILAREGRTTLDPRWTITPINGADKAPAFVSLFGANKLHIAVVLDYEPKKKRLVETLRDNPHLRPERVIPLTEITSGKEADIEDLFEPTYYLKLVNAAYKKDLPRQLTQHDLRQGGDRIVPRIEHFFDAEQIGGGTFGHAFVAERFARNTQDFPKPDDKTLERFEGLFKKLNEILEDK